MISVELLWDARSLADWQATQNQPEPDLETTDITELADKLTRVLGWLSEGDTIERLGMRCAILLYCVRPDFLPEQSLHLISGTTKQNLSKMVTDFKVSSKGVSQQFLTMTHVSQSGSELRGWSAAAAELENARALRRPRRLGCVLVTRPIDERGAVESRASAGASNSKSAKAVSP